MSDPVVEIHNVQLRNDRGSYVFRDLTLTLPTGQSAVITGAAGSGKSTLVELLVGLRFAEVGSVEVFGHLLKKRHRGVTRRIRRNIGGIGGIFGLVPSLTVADNVALPLVLAGIRKKVQRERLLKVLSEFSLLKQANDFPGSLTRVESTLVQFARASIANQALVIIDEPSAGLDPRTWERVYDFLVRVAVSGRSMLILTSDLPPKEIPHTSYYQLNNGVLS